MNKEEIINILIEELDLVNYVRVTKYLANLDTDIIMLQQEKEELKKKYENAVADYEYEKSKNSRAIEYINNYDVFKEFTFPLMKRDEENQVKSSIDYQFKNDLKEDLLEILEGEK